MRIEKCEAIVSFEGQHVEVAYSGVWTKRMIDIAHNRMINALPGHLQTLRKAQSGETKPKKEKRNG